MKRTKLIASSVVIALVAVGSYVVADKPSTPVNDEVPVQETVQVEQAPETVVTEQEQAAPTAPSQASQPQTTPTPVDPCIAEKAAALAPLQAKLDEYDVRIAERTAGLTEQYNARKAVGAIPDWVTLEYYLNYDLNQTLRPVRDRMQAEYNAEAAKFDC